MISIAFLALMLTVLRQAFLLQKAAVREELLRAEAAYQRASYAADVQRLRALLEEGLAPVRSGPMARH
jgi:hypothetical protein